LVVRGIRFEPKAKPNTLKTNRDLFADPKRASKIKVALRLDAAPAERNRERRCDGSEGDGRTCDESLE
jgi:hypothetical protein